MVKLKPGEHARIVDAPKRYRHMLGEVVRIVPLGGLGVEGSEVAFRTEAGQMFQGEEWRLLRVEAGQA